jgi:hypothetical protein
MGRNQNQNSTCQNRARKWFWREKPPRVNPSPTDQRKLQRLNFFKLVSVVRFSKDKSRNESIPEPGLISVGSIHTSPLNIYLISLSLLSGNSCPSFLSLCSVVNVSFESTCTRTFTWRYQRSGCKKTGIRRPPQETVHLFSPQDYNSNSSAETICRPLLLP